MINKNNLKYHTINIEKLKLKLNKKIVIIIIKQKIISNN